jgi:HCOMODA/2-hydroxy-3-carboxy-muconic semialdehyde decarboxylase
MNELRSAQGNTTASERRDRAIDELVAANHILAQNHVVDAYGHVSVRDPENSEQFILSYAKSPEIVERDDLAFFDMEARLVSPSDRKPYAETPIHAAIYAARPDVHAVVHNHSYSVIPFAVTDNSLRPVAHFCAPIGAHVGCWDISEKFGETNMLVVDMNQARDLAERLGNDNAVLMRGHGCVVVGRSIRQAVTSAVMLEVNARIQATAQQMGEPRFLSPREIELAGEMTLSEFSVNRAWEYWCRQLEKGLPG